MAPRGASDRPIPGVPQQPFGKKAQSTSIGSIAIDVNPAARGSDQDGRSIQWRACKVGPRNDKSRGGGKQKGDDDTFDSPLEGMHNISLQLKE